MRSLAILLAALTVGHPASAQALKVGPPATADHVALNTADAEASAAFYRRTFGMKDVPTRLPNTRWLDMGGGLTLHLIGGRTAPVSANRIVHFALRTDDLAATIAYFDAAGIPWSDFTGNPRSIQTRFDGVRQVFVQDPDGYWIEVSDARGSPAK